MPRDFSQTAPAGRSTWGFAGVAALFFAVASVAMTWPMAAKIGAHYSSRQDYYLGAWNLWWVSESLFNPERDIYYTDLLYFPIGTGLEAQPLSVLQTAVAAPLTRLIGPEATLNALVLFAFWLAGVAAALLVHRATGSKAAGLFGGVLFGFAPHHYAYLAELNLVATGFLALGCLAALAFRDRPSAARAALAGFSLAAVALVDGYYGVMAAIIAVIAALERLLRRSNASMPRRLALEAVHWACFGAALAPSIAVLAPAYIGAEHMAGPEREGLGLLMREFKGTSATMGLWSYVGCIALATAALGACPFRLRWPLAAVALLFLVFSLGDRLRLGSLDVPLPYIWLQAFPVVSALRYPDRFLVAAQLAIATLGGLGLVRVRAGLAHRRPLLATLVPPSLIALALLEFWPGALPSADGSDRLPIPASTVEQRGAVLHLPLTFRNLDGEMMLHQTRHGRAIAGGYITRLDPERAGRLRSDPCIGPWTARESLPRSESDFDCLSEAGFAYISVQRRPLVAGTPPSGPRILGPFALNGAAFLRERLFPVYPFHESWSRWATRAELEISAILGPPVFETPLAAVFEVDRR